MKWMEWHDFNEPKDQWTNPHDIENEVNRNEVDLNDQWTMTSESRINGDETWMKD